MNINGKYVQYSKVFTTSVGVGFALHIIAVMALSCLVPDAGEVMLETLKLTAAIFSMTFFSYTGNSIAEKYISHKSQTNKTAGKSNVG